MGYMKRNSQQYKQLMTFVTSKLFVFFGIGSVIFLGYALGKGFVQRNHVSAEIEELKEEIALLEKEQGDLTTLLAYLESEEFLKQEGKIKFGLKEEGEHVVVIQDVVSQQKPVLQVPRETDEVEVSNPNKWWRFFFN